MNVKVFQGFWINLLNQRCKFKRIYVDIMEQLLNILHNNTKFQFFALYVYLKNGNFNTYLKELVASLLGVLMYENNFM